MSLWEAFEAGGEKNLRSLNLRKCVLNLRGDILTSTRSNERRCFTFLLF
jgi:hypothetical protein